MVKPLIYISAMSAFFRSTIQPKDSILGSNNALMSIVYKKIMCYNNQEGQKSLGPQGCAHAWAPLTINSSLDLSQTFSINQHNKELNKHPMLVLFMDFSAYQCSLTSFPTKGLGYRQLICFLMAGNLGWNFSKP